MCESNLRLLRFCVARVEVATAPCICSNNGCAKATPGLRYDRSGTMCDKTTAVREMVDHMPSNDHSFRGSTNFPSPLGRFDKTGKRRHGQRQVLQAHGRQRFDRQGAEPHRLRPHLHQDLLHRGLRQEDSLRCFPEGTERACRSPSPDHVSLELNPRRPVLCP